MHCIVEVSRFVSLRSSCLARQAGLMIDRVRYVLWLAGRRLQGKDNARMSERGDMHRGEGLTESWVSTWVPDRVAMLPDGLTGAAIGIVSLGVAG